MAALPRPVMSPSYLLVPDTSSLLDVVRMAVRDQHVADPVSVRHVICAASDVTEPVELALIELVRKEFEDKLGGVRQNVHDELQKLKNDIGQVSRGLTRVRQLVDTVPAIQNSDDDWIEQAAQRSLSLANALLDISTPRAITQNDLALAHQRMMGARAPAQRGSVSTVDSQLTEVALRLAAERPARRTIFVTSNDKDFRVGVGLHPDLQADFDHAGLVYARSWAEVVALIR